MTPADALFEFAGVTVRFGDRVALDAVDLVLPQRRLIALVGASGSGKSTLLRLCNRLEVPTDGRIRFRGDDVAQLDPVQLRRRVGMVFQRPTPFDGSVLDNLRVADPTIDATSAVAWCARVGLSADVVEQTATTLSGGEAQRMCLARTLATRPQVVLMDEPTSALDHENALRIEDLARTLVDSDGISVIWVSHDRAQVERIADEAVEVASGRVIGRSE
ncbi:MAG: phosphate ABC transporter ATP-binding protein [Actinobacteria bacterium]|nr:phosphate ABC transporter ATP-binding protein [Actinomycetota bacterium]